MTTEDGIKNMETMLFKVADNILVEHMDKLFTCILPPIKSKDMFTIQLYMWKRWRTLKLELSRNRPA